MSTRPVPLNQLATLVQSAVEKVLAEHGAVPIDKLWFGFVAPEILANERMAAKVANEIGHVTGVHVTPAVATEGLAAGATHAEALAKPGHLIGLIYDPRQLEK